MTAPVATGEVIDGKYRVERVLGSGGMGVVVEAVHLGLDERVAIKFLQEAATGIPSVVERFAREARAMIRIKSEHVARVLDVGQTSKGAPYMVMEYLEGRDLAALLEQVGRIPAPEAVDIVMQAGEAIAEAHALGIVHRDLKPANLFLTSRADGSASVKVLDFGISKVGAGARTGAAMSLTQTAMPLGSPLYMAPEQIASARDVDDRADIWSLGAMLYELITGKAPFEADNISHLQYKILSESPPPLHEHDPELPVELDEVLQRCMRKNPDDRYTNIAELAADLARFGSSQSEASATRIAAVVSRAAQGNPSSALPSSLLGYRSTVPVNSGSGAASAPRAVASTPARSKDRPTPGVSQGEPPIGAQETRETVSSWSTSRGTRRSKVLLFAAAPVLVAASVIAWFALRSVAPAPVAAASGPTQATVEQPVASGLPVSTPASSPIDLAVAAEPPPSQQPPAPTASAHPHAPPRGGPAPRPATTDTDLFNTRK